MSISVLMNFQHVDAGWSAGGAGRIRGDGQSQYDVWGRGEMQDERISFDFAISHKLCIF